MTTATMDYSETFLPRTATRRISIARAFVRFAVLYALIGMGMGIYMGVADDFTLRPAHAHINLLGWASTMLFALTYRAVPAMSESRLAIWHLAITTFGIVGMTIAMPLYFYGQEWVHPIIGIAMLAQVIGMSLFTLIVYRHF
ncbi:hypothetical protein [Parvibaculum sp.]|uniref:hypothetical protein n=1 Tax=Parvibaculum sp. TaxID=2024848 RepID=UPI0032111D95